MLALRSVLKSYLRTNTYRNFTAPCLKERGHFLIDSSRLCMLHFGLIHTENCTTESEKRETELEE